MTLEEAIERYTSNAEYERADGSLQGCLEFKQLVEWLKDYKRLLEQEPILDKIRAEIEENAYPIVGKFNNIEKGMTLYGILQVIDKYRGESDCRECKAEHDCYECKKYEESEEGE